MLKFHALPIRIYTEDTDCYGIAVRYEAIFGRNGRYNIVYTHPVPDDPANLGVRIYLHTEAGGIPIDVPVSRP